MRKIFQSTHPSRDGTKNQVVAKVTELFQSTRPSRDGTPDQRVLQRHTGISIHPPLTGRDRPGTVMTGLSRYFNPPAPHGTGQITFPVLQRTISDFNPPAPHGTGRRIRVAGAVKNHFNPPAPHGTGPPYTQKGRSLFEFQSTRPSRDGTNFFCASC